LHALPFAALEDTAFTGVAANMGSDFKEGQQQQQQKQEQQQEQQRFNVASQHPRTVSILLHCFI